MTGVSHPNCRGPEGHVCQKPSGRTCVDCDQPAGTLWGPYWCPECDQKRLDNVSAGLASITAALSHHTERETSMPKFRKKPVVIEAMEFAGSASEAMEVYFWIEQNSEGSFEPYADPPPASGVSIDPATGQLLIATLEGVMRANPGDWIIKGTEGEFYPCKPAAFAATFESAS